MRSVIAGRFSASSSICRRSSERELAVSAFSCRRSPPAVSVSGLLPVTGALSSSSSPGLPPTSNRGHHSPARQGVGHDLGEAGPYQEVTNDDLHEQTNRLLVVRVRVLRVSWRECGRNRRYEPLPPPGRRSLRHHFARLVRSPRGARPHYHRHRAPQIPARADSRYTHCAKLLHPSAILPGRAETRFREAFTRTG